MQADAGASTRKAPTRERLKALKAIERDYRQKRLAAKDLKSYDDRDALRQQAQGQIQEAKGGDQRGPERAQDKEWAETRSKSPPEGFPMNRPQPGRGRTSGRRNPSRCSEKSPELRRARRKRAPAAEVAGFTTLRGRATKHFIVEGECDAPARVSSRPSEKWMQEQSDAAEKAVELIKATAPLSRNKSYLLHLRSGQDQRSQEKSALDETDQGTGRAPQRTGGTENRVFLIHRLKGWIPMAGAGCHPSL